MTKWNWLLCAAALLMLAGVIHAPADAQDSRAAEAVRIASQRIGDANPDVRAQAVADLARANNRDGTGFMMRAIEAETDGPAGFRMAESVQQLTSEEALAVVERSVLGFIKPEQLFGAYWTFLGLARQKSERGDQILTKAIRETKREVFIKAAAIEAIARAERTELAELLVEVLGMYDQRRWEGDQQILALAAIQGSPAIVKKGEAEPRHKVVLALADILEATKDDRMQWFVCKALAEITGEDTYIDPEFWRWWVQSGGVQVKRKEDGHTIATRDVPKFFETAAVGKRVVFVIDISGSMQHPVNLPPEVRNPPKPAEQPKGPTTGSGGRGGRDAGKEEPAPPPPPDYSRVRTRLDLAKVELIHTLEQLDESYWFNIVIYDTEHFYIDGGQRQFLQATSQNRNRMIGRVRSLEWRNLTNIHGALVRAYCTNSRRSLDPSKLDRSNNPAWHADCLATGATTIFFLTDGSPTISDDSTNIGEVGRAGGPPIGNGRMVQPNNIVADVARLNTFRKVVIHTVGIGRHNRGLMQAIARVTGGDYIDRTGLSDQDD
jgi:hypothetical protein